MKNLILIALFLLSLAVHAQTTYKGLPVIKAKNKIADYKIDSEWKKGSWHIMPELSPDVLTVSCFTKNKVNVAFYTDVDSISYIVAPGQSFQFYVLLNEKDYALTEFRGLEYAPLSFASTHQLPRYKIKYETNINNEYLKTLREKYNLEAVVKGAKNDTEKALQMMHWVHNQWKHNGDNEPKKNDAISILEEVKEGKNFRCVEYGIVTTACLNALGLKARTLGLKTKDVETTQSGAGHVLLEVYLNDLKKWVLLDSQWDAMPVVNNVPLNAVEFQQAIAKNYERLEIKSISGTDKKKYSEWIFPYLYYFDISFDNREGTRVKEKINGKSQLMLVPVGAKEPAIFQINNKIDYCLYTNDLSDFYAPPVND